MKFNKSSLLSSLAVAGIVLGAVAPVVASAADTASVFSNKGQNWAFNASGAPEQLQKTDLNKSLSSGDNHYATATGKNDATSGANAVGTSEAQVRLVSGYLTLDRVPDFNFGTVAAGSTAELQNNSGAIADDGNSDGILQVTDSRSTSGSGATALTDGMGYTVSVQLGSFYKLTGGARGGSAQNGFTLNIPQLSGSAINADSGTTAAFQGAAVVAGGDAENLLSAARGQSYGTTSVSMVKGSGINLETNKAVDDGSYDAPITWTLTTVTAPTGQ